MEDSGENYSEKALESSRISISLIIPARNEAECLGFVLDQIPRNIDEIIVVDGQSSDGTVDVALHHPRVTKVISQGSKGKGAALSLGFQVASGDYVGIIDADGSMDLNEIDKFLAKMSSNDVVKGSRCLSGGGSEDLTLVRKVGSGFLTRLANFMFSVSWTDMAYGYAFFRKAAIEELGLSNYDRQGSFLGHKSYGQGFEIEALIFTRAARRGYKICEVPSNELRRIAGSSNLVAIRDGIRVLFAMVIERMRSVPKKSIEHQKHNSRD
jgi:glycosyltransferase involved in cell wall biosynthesis